MVKKMWGLFHKNNLYKVDFLKGVMETTIRLLGLKRREVNIDRVYILTEDEYKKLKRDPFKNLRKFNNENMGIINIKVCDKKSKELLDDFFKALNKAIDNWEAKCSECKQEVE